MEYFENYDLENIVMPLNVDRFWQLLNDSNYDLSETHFLVDEFMRGFDIGYVGPINRQSRSPNILFTVGDKYDLWSKIIKEVKMKRFVGPFDEVTFHNFIQSPIGLVPKSGNKTRLIFHLSFDFGEENRESVNA